MASFNIKEKAKHSEALEQVIETSAGQQRKIINDNISISLNELQSMIDNDIYEPMKEMDYKFSSAMDTINEMAKLKLRVTSSDIERAEKEFKALEEQIKLDEQKLKDLENKAQSAQKRANKTAFKIALINVLVCCIVMGTGYFWLVNKQKNEISEYYNQLEEEIKTSIDIWSSNAEKRAEVQASAEAYDEYLEYCIKAYVSCPFIGSCDKEKERYIVEFEKKFGTRPNE